MVYQLYVASLILFAVISNFINKTNPTKSKGFDLISMRILFVILFAIMGFRTVDVGVDTYNYSYIFQLISGASYAKLMSAGFFYESMEIGYALLAKTCSLIVDDYYFFQVVVSGIFCLLCYNFIKENTSNYIFSTLIFSAIGIYLFSFNGMRQAFAIAIVINAWMFLKKNKYCLCAVISVFATFIHLSSIFFIVAFLTYYYRKNNLLTRYYLLILLVFALSFDRVIQFVAEYLTAYQNYYGNTRNIQEANMVKVLWSIESMIAIFILQKKNRFSQDDRYVAMMSLLYVCLNIVALSFNYIERIGLYLSPFLIMLFDTFYLYIKRIKVINAVRTIMFICFIIYFLMSTSTEQYEYSSILQFFS